MKAYDSFLAMAQVAIYAGLMPQEEVVACSCLLFENLRKH
jgi:hypothetical protein